MLVPGTITYPDGKENIAYTIPNEWRYYKTEIEYEERESAEEDSKSFGAETTTKSERHDVKTQTKEKKYHREKKLYRVPDEYFAVYNLAHDLTTSHRVFGRAIGNDQYQMRDGSPINIFSVQNEAETLFTNCYCAMPRWYRLADYNLFALAWNHLVWHVGIIIGKLSPESIKPDNHDLSDWIVLTLLRIQICFEMNYTPFLVTSDEREIVLAKMRSNNQTDGLNSNAEQTYKKLITSIKHFVHNGLYSVMQHIRLEGVRSSLASAAVCCLRSAVYPRRLAFLALDNARFDSLYFPLGEVRFAMPDILKSLALEMPLVERAPLEMALPI